MSAEGKGEEEDFDEIVTMQDILEEQEELTRDADAVLGGSDAENCTYQLGYVGRQALYSCKTCSGKSGVKAGICLACSLKCHDGHDLVELYTKRNFRCDCGLQDKFPDTKCELDGAKGGPNDQNVYNQNFDGKYCSCHRPYPDPEYQEDDVMIQCIACEDWFHGGHLETPVPDGYSEMICKPCTSGFDFLRYYRDEMPSVVDGDKEDKNGAKEKGELDEDGPVAKKLKTENEGEQVCKLTQRRTTQQPPIDRPSFWNENWREALCKCSECVKMYEDLKCVYLTDSEDTILSYEEKGRKRNLSGGSSIEEVEQAALNTMPRVAQIEMIHGYNDLKEELSNFFRQFADTGKVITKEDVARFMEEFKKKKESEPKFDVFSGCH